ncbi:MAG: hypothetical protein R3222_08950, partial [Balneolaceae bacterium]|nr:hypothetical protein [Balneolaceae bacterium]
LVSKKGVSHFEQDQEDLTGFISLEPIIYNNNKAFRKFLTHSFEYTSTLPAKEHDDTRDMDLDL